MMGADVTGRFKGLGLGVYTIALTNEELDKYGLEEALARKIREIQERRKCEKKGE